MRPASAAFHEVQDLLDRIVMANSAVKMPLSILPGYEEWSPLCQRLWGFVDGQLERAELLYGRVLGSDSGPSEAILVRAAYWPMLAPYVCQEKSLESQQAPLIGYVCLFSTYCTRMTRFDECLYCDQHGMLEAIRTPAIQAR